MTINIEGIILLEAVLSFKRSKPISEANIMLVSRIEETYAIGKNCIHHTANPQAKGARTPNTTPVKTRFLFTIRRPLFLKKNETTSAGVPFNKSIQYKKL